MALLPVQDAVARILAGVRPTAAETVPLASADGRVLAEDLAATRTQPPFPASAMDGYAVRAAEAVAGAVLRVAGESRAGARFGRALGPGEAVRIFTGAPIPDGADGILIQEDAERDGDLVRVTESVTAGRFVRPEGLDYRRGEVLLKAGTLLSPRRLSLAAAMNYGVVPVRRRPVVAVLSTGDELVPPGGEPGPDQIISSNGIGLAAFAAREGALPRDLGIAADRIEAIRAAAERARDAEVLVVSGGASVGDHDLVQPALAAMGMELDFWKIAMRPGKPLMVGRLGATHVLGLPGNPVSSLVCAHVFLRPLIRALSGAEQPAGPEMIPLGAEMGANDQRQDYVRAMLSIEDGVETVRPFPRQDSSMLATLAAADALIIRPPHAGPAAAGTEVPVLRLGN